MVKNGFKAGILGVAFAGLVSGAGGQTLSGAYLAANAANYDNDFRSAAQYFSRAVKADEGNDALEQNALTSFVAAGDFTSGADIAATMLAAGSTNIFAQMVVAVTAADAGDYAKAAKVFPTDDTKISPLLGGLMRGWMAVGNDDVAAGMAIFEAMKDNKTIELYAKYHEALALAYTGDFAAAADILKGDGKTPLHLDVDSIIAHAQILVELGRRDDALAVLDAADGRGLTSAGMQRLRADIAAGKKITFALVPTPAVGMSRALLTMADALSRTDPNRLALFYARLAQQLDPSSGQAVLMVGEILDRIGQLDLANIAYGKIRADSYEYKRASIARAEVLRKLGDVSGATNVLKNLVKSNPGDITVLNALGDIYRGNEKFGEAAKYYTSAIENLPEPENRYWVLYYSRGISLDRSGDWAAAKADLRQALELSPDQPQVLNYMGYSFLERNENLDEAQTMIQTAADRMPDSGYIIDSLGWMYYRLGKFEEAVAPMQHAVKLLPSDPIVNDHLGDVLWKVDRKREADFQWRRALSFGPTEANVKRISRKLSEGLDNVLKDETGK